MPIKFIVNKLVCRQPPEQDHYNPPGCLAATSNGMQQIYHLQIELSKTDIKTPLEIGNYSLVADGFGFNL